MRALVAGAAGFVGSHFVRSLLGGAYPSWHDTSVTAVDKLTYPGNDANLEPVEDSPRLTFVRGDIADGRLLADVVPGHDVVINFAAETHGGTSILTPAAFTEANVAAVQILLQACLEAKVPRVVQVSTGQVYGSIESGSWTEESPLLPNSPYPASKAAGDLICRAYARTYGLDVLVTRCSNNYGPYQFPGKIIPLFVTNAWEGRPLPLYGDGRNVREWLHVDDHCRGVQLVAEKGRTGEIYNIGGGRPLSNIELAGIIATACGIGWDRVEFVADRKGRDRRYSLESSRIAELGYSPRTAFAEGLAATIRWYRDNRWWWEPLKRRATLTGEPN